MANLDQYLESLIEDGSQYLTFRTGYPIEVTIDDKVEAISQKPATTDEIISILQPALPYDFETLAQKKTKEFFYVSPLGKIKIMAVISSDKIKARVSAVGKLKLEERGIELSLEPDDLPIPGVNMSAPPVELSLPSDDFSAPGTNLSAPQEITFGIDNELSVPTPDIKTSAPGDKIDKIIDQMLKLKASDLYLKSHSKPMVKVDGVKKELEESPKFTDYNLWSMLRTIMPEIVVVDFEKTKRADFVFNVEKKARLRVSIFMDIAGVGAVFRQIPLTNPTPEKLNLPQSTVQLCDKSKGLILLTGSAGSGKSTTVAAMIDQINSVRPEHIITIEDPVEFIHEDKECYINQREIGVTATSYKTSLNAALRENPDIVFVGELRDEETSECVLNVASTDTLLFSTIRAGGAVNAIKQILNQFSVDRQNQVYAMLSYSLAAVISQKLCRKKDGTRVAAYEVLIVTRAVANLIQEGNISQISSVMETSHDVGMQTLNDALFSLVKGDTITAEEALLRSEDKKALDLKFSEAGID